jgi:hypothetical protein
MKAGQGVLSNLSLREAASRRDEAIRWIATARSALRDDKPDPAPKSASISAN